MMRRKRSGFSLIELMVVRGQTVMTLDWIAQRLQMGCRHTVANCLKG